ncbi:hypothetical protein HZH66_014645 [Vespula vulgaris]|uniref:Uncharacterized protein n=1 Tax=Vespula vulgaris TaxID=7454 RepID=A0A834J287_VESVU|nr:hypothetical protein HZH66_014645 [Vespula vulgaris]
MFLQRGDALNWVYHTKEGDSGVHRWLMRRISDVAIKVKAVNNDPVEPHDEILDEEKNKECSSDSRKMVFVNA